MPMYRTYPDLKESWSSQQEHRTTYIPRWSLRSLDLISPIALILTFNIVSNATRYSTHHRAFLFSVARWTSSCFLLVIQWKAGYLRTEQRRWYKRSNTAIVSVRGADGYLNRNDVISVREAERCASRKSPAKRSVSIQRSTNFVVQCRIPAQWV